MPDHEKDNNIRTSKSPSNAVDYSEFVHKKTERLCAALFLTTDLIREHEPLRKGLRTKGLLLLEKAHIYTCALDEYGIRAIHATLEEIIAMLRVGVVANQLSEMNARIIADECVFLLQFLTNRSNIMRDQNKLVPSFFELALPTVSEDTYATFPEDIGQISYKGHIQTSTESSTIATAPSIRKRQNREEGKEKQRDRRAQILAILQKKDRITIKDVVAIIRNCSEKTIQRELLGLVASGVLKKEGERRWSTYSLAASTL